VATRFYLIRHGSARYELAESRRLKGMGRDLVPLTAQGVKEIELAAGSFPSRVELLISSPMTRALQSAAILSASWRVPLRVEFDLHEWLPDLSCSYDRVETVERAHEEYVLCDGEWPEGERRSWEPRSGVAARARAVLEKYAREDIGAVGVVCHGGVIDALTRAYVETGGWVEYRLSRRNGKATSAGRPDTNE
jgi:broad specificity phosphatase PhoE